MILNLQVYLKRIREVKCVSECINSFKATESTPLNKLAVVDVVWARMPVDGLSMTLA